MQIQLVYFPKFFKDYYMNNKKLNTDINVLASIKKKKKKKTGKTEQKDRLLL